MGIDECRFEYGKHDKIRWICIGMEDNESFSRNLEKQRVMGERR